MDVLTMIMTQQNIFRSMYAWMIETGDYTGWKVGSLNT